MKIFTAPIGRARLAERVARFREQLAGRDLGFRATATELYPLLLEPAGASLLGKRYIILAPDGVLWELPFPTLVNSAGSYLLQDVAISWAPSLTALKGMRQVKQERRKTASRVELLAMGNPTGAARAPSPSRGVSRRQTRESTPLRNRG